MQIAFIPPFQIPPFEIGDVFEMWEMWFMVLDMCFCRGVQGGQPGRVPKACG